MAKDGDQSEGVLEGLLGEIADDYARRLDSGETPPIEEYAQRHPALAATIREVFPALQAMHAKQAGEPTDWNNTDASRGYQPEYLGDYRIVRELGRGGMGVVYEAEQQSLHRQVALKVLPFAAVLDARQLQRFKNEAQAAANLHHANIVPVFALGCDRGVYYYAMQYIDGQPLSNVIQQLQEQLGGAEVRAPGFIPVNSFDTECTRDEKDRRRLTPPLAAHSSEAARLPSWPAGSGGSSHLTCSLTSLSSGAAGDHGLRRQLYRTIADIGIQAAEGLQYAHEHGVVHRDVKPSNLLLTPEGHLWITDFGLAMMHSQPNLTSPGDLLGTVRYMSPEQAFAKRVPVDHRTDIYSLGVTLYELLALRPAFEGNGREDLLRQIAFEDPRPLRRVDPVIPRELETIVGKAIAKRPDDRYANAQELADDLRRFLDDKPILAKPPTPLDRASKWSRRHRSVVISTAVSLVLAVIGLAASTVLVVDQRNLARAQQKQAEANLRIARGNMDRMLYWMETKTQDTSQLPSLDRVRQEALEESLAFHRSLLPEKMNDPQARHDGGKVHIVVGRIRAMMGQQAGSEQAYAEGLDILSRLAADYPSVPSYAESLARGWFQLAVTRWQCRSLVPAADAAGRAVAMFEKLATGKQDESDLRGELCRALNLTGLIARDRQQYPQAQQIFTRAIALQSEIARFCPQEPQHRVELAQIYRNLADLQVKMQRMPEATQTVELAISLQRDLANSYPDDPAYNQELCSTRRWWDEVESISQGVELTAEAGPPVVAPASQPTGAIRTSPAVLADAWGLINASLRRAGNSASSTEAYRQSVAAQEKLLADNPRNREYRERLCDLHLQQGRSMFYNWRLDESGQAYVRAMELTAATILEEPAEEKYRTRMQEILNTLKTVRAREPIATLVVPSKQSPEGVAKAVEAARRLSVDQLGSDPMSLLIYGEFLILADEPDRAVPVIRKAINLGGAMPSFHKSLGLALLRCRRVDEANAEFQLALKDWHGPQGQRTVADADEWTAAYLAGRVTAEDFAKRWADRAMCVGHMACMPWFYVGMRMEIEGKPAEARAAYLKAVEAGHTTNPHMTANLAAYRLRYLDAAAAGKSDSLAGKPPVAQKPDSLAGKPPVAQKPDSLADKPPLAQKPDALAGQPTVAPKVSLGAEISQNH